MTSDGELGDSGENVVLWMQEPSALPCPPHPVLPPSPPPRFWLADVGQINNLCLSTSFFVLNRRHKMGFGPAISEASVWSGLSISTILDWGGDGQREQGQVLRWPLLAQVTGKRIATSWDGGLGTLPETAGPYILPFLGSTGNTPSHQTGRRRTGVRSLPCPH